jgi:hypothetical protein
MTFFGRTIVGTIQKKYSSNEERWYSNQQQYFVVCDRRQKKRSRCDHAVMLIVWIGNTPESQKTAIDTQHGKQIGL